MFQHPTTLNDQDLLTELRILGSIVENDRITTNHSTKPRIRIQKPSIFRSINRILNSESRSSNVTFLQSLFNQVIEKYNSSISQGNTSLTNRIKNDTINGIRGIKNLRVTYEDDLQFNACINVLIETVELHLEIKSNVSSVSNQEDHSELEYD